MAALERALARKRAPGSVGRELRLRLLREARLDGERHADAGGRLGRVERVALEPSTEPQPGERCGRPAEIVGVVDAHGEREQSAARRRDERELLAAVARREASRRDLREPELPVETARRVEHACGNSDLDVGQAVKGHQLSFARIWWKAVSSAPCGSGDSPWLRQATKRSGRTSTAPRGPISRRTSHAQRGSR